MQIAVKLKLPDNMQFYPSYHLLLAADNPLKWAGNSWTEDILRELQNLI